jgi:hypothetical protein
LRSLTIVPLMVLCCAASIEAARIPGARVVGRVPASTRLDLAIGLPVRNGEALERFVKNVADPESSEFRRYLTPEQFTERFGPAEGDYRALISFVEAHGMTVTATHANRMILDVSGEVGEIEKAFHLNMMFYDHPVRGRFYAPDREPSVDEPGIQILHISGLDNYQVPRPMSLRVEPLGSLEPFTTGSGPGGLFIGKDFRAAYAPAVTLTGAGQTVGLLEFDGFFPSDLTANFKQAGLTPPVTQTVLLDGFNGAAGGNNIEVILDIVMAGYMAPGLTKVMVYEGYYPDDVLNRMATDRLAQQLSSSWGFGIDATTEQIFKEFMAQGQSLYQASGDSGAYGGEVMTPSDDPNLTVVGGTSLTTTGADGPWHAESAWPNSGGGVSFTYAIPSYQQGISMAANGGSATMRNLPDVAMIADVQIFLVCNNGQQISVGGTSAAAPLWAGFTALANQEATGKSKPQVGFVNPAIYAIAKGPNYASDFHDIVLGSNGAFSAVAGYDLVTGWGTPAGQHLLDDLSGVSGQPGFLLSPAAATLTIVPGGSASTKITVVDQSGFTGAVTLTATGLPAGVMAVFTPATTTSTSTLAFTAGAGAQAASATVTVNGASASGSVTSKLTLGLSVVLPNFSLSSSGSMSVPKNASGSTTVKVAAVNGFNGSVALAATGLPAGVTASFSPSSTVAASTLTFTAGSAAVAGTWPVTVTGTSGSLSHTATISLSVVAPTAGTALVSLASAANVMGIVTDGATFPPVGMDGGLNGVGTAYSGKLLGGQFSFNGTTLYFGPSDVPDAVSAATIPSPAGQYSALEMLATGVNGNQPSQTFRVTYTDGSSTAFTQSLSDWYTPQNYSGETKALTMPYRDTSGGEKDNRTFLLYGYSFSLNAAKKVSSITLPMNGNVVVLAITLVSGQTTTGTAAQMALSSEFDTNGITSDGKAFTGGMGGLGYAYSANLLGATATISGTAFTFGPANALDVASANGKAWILPAGNFSTLQMLATGINGNQTSQVFKVTYTDGSAVNYTQSFSDWSTPAKFAGESTAITMAYRNTKTGGTNKGPYYVYGYALALNNAKIVSTITTPPNANVKILAVTLTP